MCQNASWVDNHPAANEADQNIEFEIVREKFFEFEGDCYVVSEVGGVGGVGGDDRDDRDNRDNRDDRDDRGGRGGKDRNSAESGDGDLD
jgi:hypothetical protein